MVSANVSNCIGWTMLFVPNPNFTSFKCIFFYIVHALHHYVRLRLAWCIKSLSVYIRIAKKFSCTGVYFSYFSALEINTIRYNSQENFCSCLLVHCKIKFDNYRWICAVKCKPTLFSAKDCIKNFNIVLQLVFFLSCRLYFSDLLLLCFLYIACACQFCYL